MGVSSSLIWICGGCVDMWRFLFGYMVARPRGYLDLWWSAGRLTFRFRCVVRGGIWIYSTQPTLLSRQCSIRGGNQWSICGTKKNSQGWICGTYEIGPNDVDL